MNSTSIIHLFKCNKWMKELKELNLDKTVVPSCTNVFMGNLYFQFPVKFLLTQNWSFTQF